MNQVRDDEDKEQIHQQASDMDDDRTNSKGNGEPQCSDVPLDGGHFGLPNAERQEPTNQVQAGAEIEQELSMAAEGDEEQNGEDSEVHRHTSEVHEGDVAIVEQQHLGDPDGATTRVEDFLPEWIRINFPGVASEADFQSRFTQQDGHECVKQEDDSSHPDLENGGSIALCEECCARRIVFRCEDCSQRLCYRCTDAIHIVSCISCAFV